MADINARSPALAYITKPNIIVPATEPRVFAAVALEGAVYEAAVEDIVGGSGPQVTTTNSTAVLTRTYDDDYAAGQSLRKEGEAA